MMKKIVILPVSYIYNIFVFCSNIVTCNFEPRDFTINYINSHQRLVTTFFMSFFVISTKEKDQSSCKKRVRTSYSLLCDRIENLRSGLKMDDSQNLIDILFFYTFSMYKRNFKICPFYNTQKSQVRHYIKNQTLTHCTNLVLQTNLPSIHVTNIF